jgi:mono/diheme cytochrome c family protein
VFKNPVLRALGTTALIVGGITIWIGVRVLDPTGGVNLRPNDPELVAKGKQVYTAECASCHGANLEGQANWQQRGPDGLLPAPPHDVSGHTWHHPDAILFALTKYGPAAIAKDPTYRTSMPIYEDVLSDADIIAVLSYIKSTWPAEIRARHDTLNQQYADR